MWRTISSVNAFWLYVIAMAVAFIYQADKAVHAVKPESMVYGSWSLLWLLLCIALFGFNLGRIVGRGEDVSQ
jgi:hypothetical protein